MGISVGFSHPVSCSFDFTIVDLTAWMSVSMLLITNRVSIHL